MFGPAQKIGRPRSLRPVSEAQQWALYTWRQRAQSSPGMEHLPRHLRRTRLVGRGQAGGMVDRRTLERKHSQPLVGI